MGFRLELHGFHGLPPACRVGAPVAELRDVGMAAFGQRLRIEDALDGAAAFEPDRTAIEIRRLARLDPPPDLVGHEIELARDRHPALCNLEHAGVAVADRVQPVERRRARLAQELCALEVGVEREATHQRAVDEQLEGHGQAPRAYSAAIFSSSLSGGSNVKRCEAGSSRQATARQIAARNR
jgi:hypothetical protein